MLNRVFRPLATMLSSALVGVVMTSSAMALEVGDPAPALTLPVLGQEQQVSLQQYRGKVIYLDFWASWCAPCRKSMPFMETLHQELPADDFVLLAVNLDDAPEAGLRFVEKYGVNYLNLFDGQATSPEQFGVMGMPTSLLIDRQGVVQWVHQGFNDGDRPEIRQQIEQLL